MHLLPPMYSTTGKKKGKKKFASAEHARKAREQEESWKALLKRQGISLPETKQKSVIKPESLSSVYRLSIPEGRNTTDHIKSLPFSGGACTKPAPKVYTGDKVKGIATMHKSNAVPVFSDEQAVDISKMRR